MIKPGEPLQAGRSAKQASAGQLLLKCARLLDEIAIGRVNRQAGAPLFAPSTPSCSRTSTSRGRGW